MERAVGVPGGKGRVIGMARRVVNLLVGTAIGTVHVAEKIRVNVRMIQRGVERLRRRLVAGAEVDPRELIVPRFLCGGACAVEIPRGDFRMQVGARAFEAHRRETDLDEERLTGDDREIQVRADHFARRTGTVTGRTLPGDGSGKFRDEKDRSFRSPGRVTTEARGCVVVLDVETRRRETVLPDADVADQVDEDVRRARDGKRVAMKPGVGGGGQLDVDFRVGEFDLIVTGLGVLMVVRKRGAGRGARRELPDKG